MNDLNEGHVVIALGSEFQHLGPLKARLFCPKQVFFLGSATLPCVFERVDLPVSGGGGGRMSSIRGSGARPFWIL